MIRVAVSGANGRMGQLVKAMVQEDPGLELVAELEIDTDKEKVLSQAVPDVIIDFTEAKAVEENARAYAKHADLVIGTTAMTMEQLAVVEKAVKENDRAAVIAPNMSLGVNFLFESVKDFTKALQGYDIEIIEEHHNKKKDSPSGTANKLAQNICETLGTKQKDSCVYGRQGLTPRKEGEIGVHAVRAGDIVGEHTIVFAGIGERIELTHKAHSRNCFASGAIKAAKYVKGKKGIHDMKQVLGL